MPATPLPLVRSALALTVVGAAAILTTSSSPARAAVPAGTIALTPERTFTIPITGNSGSAWAMAPDGTFWIANTGAVSHVDEQGTDAGGGFAISSSFIPSQVAVDDTRLYLSTPGGGAGDGIAVWSLAAGANQTPTTNDAGTSSRYDGQAYLDVHGSTMFLPTGQMNKIGLVDLSTFGTKPFYGQSWYGLDINETMPKPTPAWEACVYDGGGVVNGTPADCGTHGGYSRDVLDYPVDVAVGTGGLLYVLNNMGNDVSVLAAGSSGYTPASSFGGSGSGAGQLSAPSSIVRDPASGNLFIADTGNDRISEFAANGDFLAAFGYGVLDGASTWEACGVGIGDCRAGLAHHYYAQLALHGSQLFVEDIGADNARGHLQVLDLGGAPAAASPSAAAPSTAAPTSAAPTTVAPVITAPKPSIKLKADHTSVKASGHAKLTATVGPALGCAGRTVAFQRQKGHTWVTLTRLKTGKKCTASLTSPTITGTTKVRALLQTSKHVTQATSPTVTIKLK